jgi:hypothetical protein
MSFTNAQLAQQIADLITYWSSFNEEYSDWLGGTVDGGPGSDGRYPLTNWAGAESLVDSPAKLADNVSGYVGLASASEAAAAASAAAAATSESNASTSASTATAQAALADADRVAAETAEANAASSQTVATAQANLATDRAGYAQEWANLPYNTLVSSAAGGDQVDDYSARHWAEHAASLNPGASPQSYLRSDIADQADAKITFAAGIDVTVGEVDIAGLRALSKTNNFLYINGTSEFTSGTYFGGNVQVGGTLRVNGSMNFDGTTSWNETDVTNWQTAYGWGDHASAGYAAGSHTHAAADITTGTIAPARMSGNMHTVAPAAPIMEFNRWGANYDMDLIVEPGQYGGYSSMTNGPTGFTYDPFWVGASASDVSSLLVVPRTASRGLAWRGETSSVVTAWHYAAWTTTAADADLSLYAKKASPTFTGTVNMSTLYAGNIDSSGSITASSDFKIDSGNGNGLGFWSGPPETYGIYMSSATDGTYGGRVNGETTSDYNIYFEMNSGTNRGFVFETDGNKLFSINPDGVYADVAQLLIQRKGTEGDVRLIVEADSDNLGAETDQAEIWVAQDGRGVLGYFRTVDNNNLEIGSSQTTVGTYTTPVMQWAYNSNAVTMPGSLTVTGNIAAGNIPAYNSFTGSAIVTRHASGYIFSNYFNQSISSTTSGTE